MDGGTKGECFSLGFFYCIYTISLYFRWAALFGLNVSRNLLEFSAVIDPWWLVKEPVPCCRDAFSQVWVALIIASPAVTIQTRSMLGSLSISPVLEMVAYMSLYMRCQLLPLISTKKWLMVISGFMFCC